jgi:hypothetical protein
VRQRGGREGGREGGRPEDASPQHLWSRVVWSAHETHRAGWVAHFLLGEPIVDEDDVTLRVEHHIVRFDVSEASEAHGEGQGELTGTALA